MSTSDQDIHALHRYFIWSMNLRDQFTSVVSKQGNPADLKGSDFNRWLTKPFMYASLWFASLYVVIEGYQTLSLTDPEVDSLLDSPHVKLLKRFRNGAYHYQKHYFDRRFTDFLTDDVVDWAKDLHDKLSSAFIRWAESSGLKIEYVRKIIDGIEVIRVEIEGSDGERTLIAILEPENE